jgi:hypothetical protein
MALMMGNAALAIGLNSSLTLHWHLPMDGSPQRGSLHATTLWHFDAAEWAPSTASLADISERIGASGLRLKADVIGVPIKSRKVSIPLVQLIAQLSDLMTEGAQTREKLTSLRGVESET